MADDSEMGSSPDAGRPKRPPPTIELKAAEVTDKPIKAEPVMPEPDVPETPPEHIDTAPSDMPPFDTVEPVAEEPAPPPPRTRTPILVPAAVGAVAGAIVAGIAWFALDGVSGSDKSDLDALTARVATIEARPTATPDASFAPRIDALEKSVAAIRSDLAAAKTQSDRAAADLNQLKSAPRGTPAAAVDLGPINDRLAQIERAAGDLKTSAAQQNAKPVDDTALRRVVAASLLDTSVRQGEPYAAALAAVEPLARGASLKPLDAFAAMGVPSAAALSRDLLALLPKLAPAPVPTASTGGWIDRLQAGVVQLLHIERTDTPGTSSNGAAISRATAAARSNDIAAAKRELLALSPADRAAVQPWLDKVDARDAALASSRQFAADAVAALSKPAP